MSRPSSLELNNSLRTLEFIERLKIPALIIVILITVLTLMFFILRSNEFFDPENLLLIFYSIFIFLPSVVIAIVAGRGFLRSGSWPVLWPGIGTLSFGIAAIIGSFLIGRASINIAVTVFNLLAFFASFLFFVGAFFVFNRVPEQEERSARFYTLLEVYIGPLIIIAFITNNQY